MADEPEGMLRFDARSAPLIAFALVLVFIGLSFFVGWHSVGVEVLRWEYDPNQPDAKGNPLPLFAIDLQMRMLDMEVHARPALLDEAIERQGVPTYEEAATNIGTQMRGIFVLQLALGAVVLVTGLFLLVDRVRRQTGTLARLGMLFAIASLFTLVMFGFVIGDAAQQDTRSMLDTYRFDEDADYDLSQVGVGFWMTWKTEAPTKVNIGTRSEIWEVTVESRPSTGWWLTLASVLVFGGGALIQRRLASQDNATRPPAALPVVEPGRPRA